MDLSQEGWQDHPSIIKCLGFSQVMCHVGLKFAKIIDFLRDYPSVCSVVGDNPTRRIEAELRSTLKNYWRIGPPGVERYLGDDKTIKHAEIINYSDKNKIIDTIIEDIDGLGYYEDLSQQFGIVSWELIMNGVFDAPWDHEQNKPKYAHLIHQDGFTLLPEEKVLISWGWDQDTMVVVVKDKWGRMTKKALENNIHRCLQKEDSQIRDEGGGAGLGLYMTFYQANQFDYQVDIDQATYAVGVIYPSKMRKKVISRFRSVNFFGGKK